MIHSGSIVPLKYQLIEFFEDAPMKDNQLVPLLNTLKNHLERQDKANNSQNSVYQIEFSQDGICLYHKVDQEARKVELGFSRPKAIFFSEQSDSQQLYQKLQSVKVLDENDCLQMASCLCLQSLNLVPRFFAYQDMRPEEFVTHFDKTPEYAREIKQISSVPIDQGAKSFFEGIFASNKGLFIGHSHDEFKGVVDLLTSQMENLSKCGVRHIYEELPAAGCLTHFEAFNSYQDNGQKLKKFLTDEIGDHKATAADSGLVFFSPQDVEDRLQLYKTARKHGIKVLPIDVRTHSLHIDVDERVRVGDKGMAMNVRFFSKMNHSTRLQTGEKYIALCGGRHHNLADFLDVPNVLVTTNPADKFGYVSERSDFFQAIFTIPDFYVTLNDLQNPKIFNNSELFSREVMELAIEQNLVPAQQKQQYLALKAYYSK